MSNRAERRRAAKRPPAPAPVVAATTTASAEREALVVTHYFNAGDLEDNATIRLTGKQIDGPGTSAVSSCGAAVRPPAGLDQTLIQFGACLHGLRRGSRIASGAEAGEVRRPGQEASR